MRKLLILSILPILTAAGCANESLRRMEVWKQQTLFTPSETAMYAPPAPQGVYAARPVIEASPPQMSIEAAPAEPSASAEEVHGVLEQP